ncbi:MAG: bifunctional 3-(3-hydroxy-phenyl)propionate/3-hydroxycinnamic acid hydroxylase [Ilumatobacteraceae bacterium]
MTATISLPVVVVGAGPTGLTLAGLLAAAGTPTILVERNPSTSSVPKAISCDDETLRALTRGRLAYTLDSVLMPGAGTKYLGAHGQTLVYARSQDPPRFGHPVKSPFSQPDFERELLAGIVRAGGVDLRFGATVTGLVQDSNAVTVAIRSADGSEQAVRASYVVGCDGGRSTIRGLLGVKMRGESFSDRWLVVDTANDPHNDRYAIHVGNPHRPHVIVAGRDATCRYEFLLKDSEAPGDVIDHDLLAALLAPYRTISREEVVRQTIYTFHALNAERWRVGRCFLAGDAAHMMPPFAGQGMNSGIRDADNLSWKLSMVVGGTAPESLLASYELERRPHTQLMIDLSVKLGRIVMNTNVPSACFRDAAVRALNVVPPARRWLAQMRFRPRPHYASGLITTIGENTSPLLGRMFPQPLVLDESGRIVPLDSVLGDGYCVLLIDPPAREIDSRLVSLASTVTGTVRSLLLADRLPWPASESCSVMDAGFQAEFTRLKGKALLVRPDRYVAAIFDPDTAPDIEQWARDTLVLSPTEPAGRTIGSNTTA